MNQKERMLKGMLYNCNDKSILEEQFMYLELLYEFNQTRPSELEKRNQILRRLLGALGSNCYVEPPLHANWGKHTHFGNNVYANFNLTLVDDGDIFVGDNVMFAPNVILATASHPIIPTLRSKSYQYNQPIHIGNGVWIGAGSIVLPGVNIGENSVIGAGSIVTKDIPDNVVAYGNPCKVIRKISDKDKKYYFKDLEIDWENLNV